MSFNVQQFQLLQNETQKYKSQAAQADMLRRRELEAIKQLQQTQIALEQELVEANAAHGEEMRKLKHNQEASDFRAPVSHKDSTLTPTKGIEEQERAEKKKWCNEIESLSTEIEHLLQQREDRKIMSLMGSDQIKWLIEMKLSPQAIQGNAKLMSVADNLRKELPRLIELEKRGQTGKHNLKTIKTILDTLRARFLAENSNYSQQDLARLEEKWAQHQSDQFDANTKDVRPGHMHLFYDAHQQESDIQPQHDHAMMDVDSQQEDNGMDAVENADHKGTTGYAC
ncbi:hypothetical protein THAOC_02618 [Thalassiosira oceanica]|uniref:Uncharacterized protein n=1 Tax=Thalassiosira oceanica TaxID=159749 RepID=K0TEZ7_THAOC|nr:hypothetical protein THAOC_02618 [Thalassiosira oceanica]|eukprot:EJK75654.1 hypothetical protein THAOC_02618 [Thalassiosira oceanica]